MEIPLLSEPITVRYQEQKPVHKHDKTNLEWAEPIESTSPALGVPIKVTRPLKRGGFETVMTDTLSNAKYMADYVKWHDEQAGG